MSAIYRQQPEASGLPTTQPVRQRKESHRIQCEHAPSPTGGQTAVMQTAQITLTS